MRFAPRFSVQLPALSLILLVSLLLTSCQAFRKTGHHTTYSKAGKEKSLRTRVVREVQRYVGVPYQFGGTNPGSGFDCSGLTCYVFGKQGVKLPRVSRDQARVGRRIHLKYAKPGDLVFFGRRGRVSHVGIVVENKNGDVVVIHSTSSKGVRKDHILQSRYWKRRVLFARDVLGGTVTARK